MGESYWSSLAYVEATTITDRGADGDPHSVLRQNLATAVSAVCPEWLNGHRDDIVQNAMMAVLRQEEKRGDEAHFSAAYLKKTAFTATIDEIRRRRSRGEVPLETDEQPSLQQHLVDLQANPERGAMAHEISVGIRGCLAGLASPRQMAVTLRLMGYRVPQIAQKMGWTRKQAENLVFRGTTDLRACLRSRGLEP